MKKVLIISQYFLPDITAASFRIAETAEILQKKGIKVSILTAKPHKETLESNQNINKKIDIIRAPITALKREGKINYIFHYLSFFFSAIIFGLFKTKKFDYIIATSPPIFTGISGWFLSKIKNTKFILDIRDIWPDSIVGAGKISKNSLFYKITKKIEKFLYKKPDLITCVSKKMKEYIKQYTNTNIKTVYNGFNKDIIPKINKIPKKEFQKIFNNNNPTITYMGNIGNAQNLEVIIKAAKEFQNKINFLLIGGGVLKEKLKKEAKKNNLKNIAFKGPYPKEKAMSFAINSWALFLNLKQSSAFQKTIPSKVFDYMYTDKPIIFGIEGEGKVILNQSGGNIYFESENDKSLIKTLKKLYNNYKDYLKKSSQNKKILFKKYTRQKNTEKIYKFIEQNEKKN